MQMTIAMSKSVELTQPIRRTIAEKQVVMYDLIEVWRGFDSEIVFEPGKRPALRQDGRLPRGETGLALARRSRELLETPATPEEIRITLSVLTDSFKWPGREVIRSRGEYLGNMHRHLALQRYPAAVLYRAMVALPQQEDIEWMPSINRVLKTCNKARAAAWAAIRWLEAPEHDRFVVTYEVAMGVITKQEGAEQLLKLERRREDYI
jgi:hypothetical protein